MIALWFLVIIYYVLIILFLPVSWVLWLTLRFYDKKYFTFKRFYKELFKMPIEAYKEEKEEYIKSWYEKLK